MNRRKFLLAGLGSAALGLSGCSGIGDDSDRQDTLRTPSTGGRETPTEQLAEAPTTTSADDLAPKILDYEALPQQNGAVMEVYLEGRDDRELAEARIVYGDREIAVQPDGNTVVIDDRFEDAASASPTDGRVAYILADGAGNENRAYVNPDETAPELAFSARPAKNAGEVAVEIDAQDDTGLADVRVFLGREIGEEVLNKDVAGQQRYTEGLKFTVPSDERFQRNRVTAMVDDWNGNSSRKGFLPYVRKYDATEDTRLDIGAVYISQQGGGFRQHCRDSYEGIEPAVGIYDEDPIPTEVSTKHIDQMTGHGITRLVYDYGGFEPDKYRVPALMDSPLIDQIEIEPFYTKTGLLWRMFESWKETVLPEDLNFLRDTILSRDNISTYDGRPVISTWNFNYFLSERDAHVKLMKEFGSYENFVDDMRSHLRTDGKDPFLIFGKGPASLREGTERTEFLRHFDGITTWFPGGDWSEGGETSWDEIIDRVESYFENNQRYAEEHDMEFTPRIFPGYDERGSECGRQGDKYFPRRPDRFRQLIELAEQYATSDRIDIASWNDWTEGHQVEPGRFNGNIYGTDYLEIVKEFQTN